MQGQKGLLRVGVAPRTGWLRLCHKPLHKRLRHTLTSAQAFWFAQWKQVAVVGRVGDEGNSQTDTTVPAASEEGDWREGQY